MTAIQHKLVHVHAHAPPPAAGLSEPVGGPPVTHTISEKEWTVIARRMDLSRQQGLIVRLMLTLPREDTTNAGIAWRLPRGRNGKRVQKATIDEQFDRIYEKLDRAAGGDGKGGGCRMDLAVRVCTELAAIRGSISATGKGPADGAQHSNESNP